MMALTTALTTTAVSRVLGPRALYLGDMFADAARRHSAVSVTLDRPVGVLDRADLTYTVGELADHVDDLAGRLWAAGVRPSERVVVHKRPNVDIALLACAAARIGAVPVMVSPALDGPTVAVLLGRLGLPWLVTDAATLSGSLADVPLADLTRRVLSTSPPDGPAPDGPAPDGAESNGAEPDGAESNGAPPDSTVPAVSLGALAGAPRVASVRMHRREPALITHTSGTTGVPKLMVHCAEAIWHRVMAQRVIAWPVRGRETVAMCMSFVHSRFYHELAVFLHYGNPLAILVDTDPDRVAPLFRRLRPGVVETHPNNFIQWEDLVDAPGDPLSSVRYYSSTFDAIHPRTVERLLGASRRPRPALVQLYGQSETGPISGWVHTRRNAGDGRCVGLPLPGLVRLRVVDGDGRPVRRGRTGHLEVMGPGRVLTYLGEHERYLDQQHDGWWRLGDMGFLDRWGLLYLTDRAIDRIGDVDSNLEVEDVLLSRLAELLEVVIVPTAEGRPLPLVCTRRDTPLDRARWTAAMRDLPAMQDPLQWRFAELPRTSTWKVRRLEIAAMIRDGRHSRHLVGEVPVPAAVEEAPS